MPLYSGSKFFEPVAKLVSIEVDKFNFIICMLFACLLGGQFCTRLGHKTISYEQRHIFAFLGGFTLASFCFGYQVIHLIIPIGISYCILQKVSYKYAHFIIMAMCFAHLSSCHIHRQYYDYGGYILDITGPLMVLVLRLSMLAFNLHDGEKLKRGIALKNPKHNAKAIETFPSLLEFFSYNLNFQTVMIGPFIYYQDYLRYIEGRELEYCVGHEERQFFQEKRKDILTASTQFRKHLFYTILFVSLHLFVLPMFPLEFLTSNEFYEYPLIMRICYMMVTTPLLRFQYYFAWSLASTTSLCSGLGFCGFDTNLKPQYNLINSFNPLKIEFGGNLKEMINNWNIPVHNWLRVCVYERVNRVYGVICVFITSAIWHGFYPGYHLFFLSAILFTEVARLFRRKLWPYFLQTYPDTPLLKQMEKEFFHQERQRRDWNIDASGTASEQRQKKMRIYSMALSQCRSYKVYHLFTTFASMFTLSYMATPFAIMSFKLSLVYWSQFYFSGHVIAIFLFLFLRFIPTRRIPNDYLENYKLQEPTHGMSGDEPADKLEKSTKFKHD